VEKQQRLNELADFLRTRRARLRPEDIDFPSGPRRKTPGLRREEVAEKAGISVTTGNSQTASFTTGTSITLTVSGGRSAIFSGACSSGGNKRTSCTFTLNGTASVSANVQ